MQRNFAVFLMISLMSTLSYGDMSFFSQGEDIDYWDEGKTIPELSIDAFRRRAVEKASGESSQEFWDRMNDPQRLEFWDDGGGYYAPEAYRRAAINPTDENIRRYLEWEERRTQMVGSFVEKLQTFAQEDVEQRRRESLKQLPIAQTTITYVYSGVCSACQKHVPVIEELKRMGFPVRFINRYPETPELHPGSIPWQDAFEGQFPIEGTPTSFITVGSKTARLAGARQASDYITTIRHLLGGPKS